MLSELSDDFADYVIEQFGRAFVDETFADHFGLFDVFSSGILVDVLAKYFYFICGESLKIRVASNVVGESLFSTPFATYLRYLFCWSF